MKITTIASFLLVFCWIKSVGQPLYDPNQIAVIEITFPQSNWDQLLDEYYAAGSDQRLLATVEINGIQFDSVGVRYRGGGTYNPDNAKNPLNIKLDYVKNKDYQGYNVLKLGNGAKDPSWLREVLSFEIARKYMVAPQANYTSVYVNGNFLGLYNNVESINSSFFAQRFLSNPDNPRFECSPSYDYDTPPVNPPPGCSAGHGAVLEYLGNNIACYLDHYVIQSQTGWEDLRDMTQLLQSNPNNARQVLDIDRFIWMSALNSLLANFDSYLGAGSRNYFIGKADNGRFVPIPDDMNRSFSRFPWASVEQTTGPQPPLNFYRNLDPYLGAADNTKPLLKAIFNNPTWKRMYTAHLRTMMAEVFSSGWFEQRAEALQNQISDEVLSDGNHFYTYDEFLQNLNETVIDSYDGEDAYGLIPFMEGRIAYLSNLPEFTAAPPAISNISTTPAQPQPGTQVTITAQVSNAASAVLGQRRTLKDMFELTPMFDDGAHGDGAADDGVFGVKVTVQTGGFQYYIYAENSGAGVFSPQRAEYEYYSVNTSGDVVINELMTANQTTVADQDGEYDDWAELYNNSASSVNLAGWYLSDDPQLLNKWQFPNGVFLNPGAFLTIWVDDDEDQAGLHASFNLSAGGEDLFLVRPDLTIADQVVFGAQAPDVSLARCPNGTGPLVKAPPSFGVDNSAACSTDTDDPARDFEVSVTPNPAWDYLRISTKLPAALEYKIASPAGLTMQKGSFRYETEVNTGEWPQGLYFLEIDGKARYKILIIK